MEKKGKLQPAGADDYSYKRIYAHYDREVVSRYAAWILQQADRVAGVVDVHGPISRHVSGTRETNPDYVLSGDGIHLNETGHRLMAGAIHEALTGKPLPTPDPAALTLVRKRQALLHPAWLSHVGHKRPGVRAGLPLEDAQARAEALNTP
jgi:hypothetical protein